MGRLGNWLNLFPMSGSALAAARLTGKLAGPAQLSLLAAPSPSMGTQE